MHLAEGDDAEDKLYQNITVSIIPLAVPSLQSHIFYHFKPSRWEVEIQKPYSFFF